MRATRVVQKILANYESDNPGTKANLCRILMNGKLGGTGKMIILPVDQGFEHGPARSFAPNPAAYDPHYHFQLAIDAGLNAFATPLGMMEAGADTFAGQVPTILKVNSANALLPNLEMMEEITMMIEEAKAKGIAAVVWSYPRGEAITKAGELAIDVSSYAAHMAALLGAHIIKVKLATADMMQDEAKKVYKSEKIAVKTQADRVADVVKSSFNGRRLVVFSGGSKKGANSVYDDARAIRDGGGNGSIIGRNTFQRERGEALEMLGKLIEIYKGKA